MICAEFMKLRILEKIKKLTECIEHDIRSGGMQNDQEDYKN